MKTPKAPKMPAMPVVPGLTAAEKQAERDLADQEKALAAEEEETNARRRAGGSGGLGGFLFTGRQGLVNGAGAAASGLKTRLGI